MNSSAKKAPKVSAEKKRPAAVRPVVARKAAVEKKAVAKSPVKTRRAVVAKKPVARRRTSTKVSTEKPSVAELIENPMDYAIPLMASAVAHETHGPEMAKTQGTRADGGSRRKVSATSVLLMTVCAAALIAGGSIAIGSSGRTHQPAPSKTQSYEPAASGAGHANRPAFIEPVAAIGPAVQHPVQPAVRVMPLRSAAGSAQDVSWANEIIQGRMNRIAGLYSLFRSAGPELTGTLAAHLEVEPDGHVGRAWLETDSINNTEFSQKVIRELITARFAPTGMTGPVGLIVPIGFGNAGTKLMAVAAHNARMPGDTAVPGTDTFAGAATSETQRNS